MEFCFLFCRFVECNCWYGFFSVLEARFRLPPGLTKRFALRLLGLRLLYFYLLYFVSVKHVVEKSGGEKKLD